MCVCVLFRGRRHRDTRGRWFADDVKTDTWGGGNFTGYFFSCCFRAVRSLRAKYKGEGVNLFGGEHKQQQAQGDFMGWRFKRQQTV